MNAPVWQLAGETLKSGIYNAVRNEIHKSLPIQIIFGTELKYIRRKFIIRTLAFRVSNMFFF